MCLELLSGWLHCYPKIADDALYLAQGFQASFDIILMEGKEFMSGLKNLKSPRGMEKIVRSKIMKEVRRGLVAVPFVALLLIPLYVAPLGIVPLPPPSSQ